MKNHFSRRIALSTYFAAVLGMRTIAPAATPVNLDVVNPTTSTLTDAVRILFTSGTGAREFDLHGRLIDFRKPSLDYRKNEFIENKQK